MASLTVLNCCAVFKVAWHWTFTFWSFRSFLVCSRYSFRCMTKGFHHKIEEAVHHFTISTTARFTTLTLLYWHWWSMWMITMHEWEKRHKWWRVNWSVLFATMTFWRSFFRLSILFNFFLFFNLSFRFSLLLFVVYLLFINYDVVCNVIEIVCSISILVIQRSHVVLISCVVTHRSYIWATKYLPINFFRGGKIFLLILSISLLL